MKFSSKWLKKLGFDNCTIMINQRKTHRGTAATLVRTRTFAPPTVRDKVPRRLRLWLSMRAKPCPNVANEKLNDF